MTRNQIRSAGSTADGSPGTELTVKGAPRVGGARRGLGWIGWAAFAVVVLAWAGSSAGAGGTVANGARRAVYSRVCQRRLPRTRTGYHDDNRG